MSERIRRYTDSPIVSGVDAFVCNDGLFIIRSAEIADTDSRAAL